ncbi:hypothetical protein [Methanosarcina sp. DH2]|uniref:hypothetical protein n=1 Tax=Methanosarcina sp. DH2 TaxID=2605639 RepID=UPI001E5B4597|nr:hypothetical protein [Methanosarcina sp. DH2]
MKRKGPRTPRRNSGEAQFGRGAIRARRNSGRRGRGLPGRNSGEALLAIAVITYLVYNYAI